MRVYVNNDKCNKYNNKSVKFEMGNIDSQGHESYPQGLSNFTEVRRQNNGKIVSQKKEGIRYFLKQFNFMSKKQYETEYKKLQNISTQPQNQNILALIRIFSQTFKNICSTNFKIYALYQYPLITLEEQIVARKKQNKYFQECELWSILQSCANALSQLNPILSLHPKNIFIVPDGVLKIINNEMIDEDYRYYIKKEVYYAPQKITEFKKAVQNEDLLRKQSIFSLGMTILHATLLEPVNTCYNYESCQFYKQILEKYIQNVIMMENGNQVSGNSGNRMYSQQFIQILAMILQPYPNKRVSLMEVHAMLNKIWNTQISDPELSEQTVCQNRQQSVKVKKSQQQNPSTAEKQIILSYPKEGCKNIKQQQLKKQIVLQSGNKGVNYYQIQKNPKPVIQEINNYHYQGISNLPAKSVPIQHNYFSQPYMQQHQQYKPLNHYQQFHSNTNHIIQQNANKQNNLYTDPKLLEMIKKYLKQIKQLKKSSIIMNGNQTYTNLSNSGVGNRYCSTFGKKNIDQIVVSNNSFGGIDKQYVDSGNSQTGVLVQRNQNVLYLPNKQQKSEQKHQLPEIEREAVKTKEQGFSKSNAVFIAEEYQDGRRFEGVMVDGVKEGHGKLIYSDGAYYEGDFKNDRMEGKGTLYYGQNKPAYEGDWIGDQFHGFGILHNENPLQLTGGYNYNDFNLIEDFWVRYEGHFDTDNKCGEGKLVLSNGQQFYGQFNNDFIHGKGVFLTLNGQISGEWQNNILIQVNARSTD